MKTNCTSVILANQHSSLIGIESVSDIATNLFLLKSIEYANDSAKVVLGLNQKFSRDAAISLELQGISTKYLPDTRGALATIGLLLDLIPEDKPIAIIPTNAWIIESLNTFISAMQAEDAEVGIAVIPSTSPELSYVRMVGEKIVEIHEKEVVGDFALSGHYYFSRKQLLIDCLDWALLNNINKDGLLYIAPSLNYCITQSIRISSFPSNPKFYQRQSHLKGS